MSNSNYKNRVHNHYGSKVPLLRLLLVTVILLAQTTICNSSKAGFTFICRRHRHRVVVVGNTAAPPPYTTTTTTITTPSSSSSTTHLFMSDWSDFAFDDEDEELNISFADENDTQEQKAEVGQLLEAPTIADTYVEPIFTPQGTVLPLTEENILGVLSACREEIGTLFGYTAENRGVGITGGVDFVEMDGPIVVLSLKGRFWHQRTTVLDRVSAYLTGRIPEIIDVTVLDDYMLTDEANNAAS